MATLLQRGARALSNRLLAYAQYVHAAAAAPGGGPTGLTEDRLTASPVPGFTQAPQWTPSDRTEQAERARDIDSLFGRISQSAGPTQTRWTTFTGQFTPESIHDAMSQANAGYPALYQDQCEKAVEIDAHLGGIIEQRISGIINKPDRVETQEHLRDDKAAVGIASWMRSVKAQIEDWDLTRFALLWADGGGYSAGEIVWEYRPITWQAVAGTFRTDVFLVPRRIETVHPRHFIFHQQSGEPLLWLWNDYLTLPPGKFVFHRAYGFSPLVEHRGYMRGCIFLHAMKHWDLRDMAIYLHLYGIPQMAASYDKNVYSYEQARKIVERVLKNFGQGKIPTIESDVTLQGDISPAVSGALVHSDAAKFLNDEMSKRVLYATLTAGTGGGSSSFALGTVHQGQMFDARLLSAQGLCKSLERFCFRPALHLNTAKLMRILGITADELRTRVPDYSCRIDQEQTPTERLAILKGAAAGGCKGSIAQIRHEFHVDPPRGEDDEFGGESVTIPSGGAAVSGADSTKGVSVPKPEQAAA